MKKIFLIFISIIFLTGCTVEYNLDIDKKFVEENISVSLAGRNDKENIINNLKNTDYPAFSNSISSQEAKYNFKINPNKESTVNYNYKFIQDDYILSSALNRCVYKHNVVNTEKHYILDFKDITCLYDDYAQVIDEIVVNMKTSYKVIDNNSDSNNKKIYTWKINKENYKTKRIYIKLEKDKKITTKSYLPYLVIGFIILIVISLLIFKLFKFKIEKENII